VEQEPVKYAGLREALSNLTPHPILYETEEELIEICKALAQISERTMFAYPETVELDQSAANVIAAIEASMREYDDLRRAVTKEHEQVPQKDNLRALGREPVHPFPARMAPGIALGVMSGLEESLVLDPMMGQGRCWRWLAANGHRGIGFDIDPLAVLISKVWTTALDPRSPGRGKHRAYKRVW